MEKYQLLFESVFKKDPASADTVDFLEKITETYPYFSTAQFYLLQSLKKDSPAYRKQVKKTAAVFNNNYWLNFQLMEAGMPHTLIVDQQKFSLEEKVSVNDNDELVAPQTDPLDEPPVKESIELNHRIEEVSSADDTANFTEDNTLVAAQPEPVELVTANEVSREQIIEAALLAETAAANEITNFTEDNTSNADQQGPVEVFTHDEKTDEPVIEVISTTPPEPTHEIKEGQIDTSTATPVSAKEAESGIPPFKLSIEPVSTTIAEDAPLFEPLHTTDYFASVGIKLSEEAKSADKLGKQLKSFTEWLKTMKKVHAEQLMKFSTPAEIEADNTESNIQQLAEKSNAEEEVVTEAMADVLLQQGRKNKAIEVLEKLSLLDPGKSAYFAAKINQIKEP